MPRNRTKNSCTAGVYLIEGPRGFKIGESKCVESRLGPSSREVRQCTGPFERARLLAREKNPRKRKALERELIQRARKAGARGGRKLCNRYDR